MKSMSVPMSTCQIIFIVGNKFFWPEVKLQPYRLTAISLDSTGYFLLAVDLTQAIYHVLRDIEQSINAVPQCINSHNEQHGIEINHLKSSNSMKA